MRAPFSLTKEQVEPYPLGDKYFWELDAGDDLPGIRTVGDAFGSSPWMFWIQKTSEKDDSEYEISCAFNGVYFDAYSTLDQALTVLYNTFMFTDWKKG